MGILTRIPSRGLLIVCFALVVGRGDLSQSQQRVRREYPPQSYYVALEIFEEGEFSDAIRAFRSVARTGVRSTEGRWVDSICYHAMLGECYYEMGDLRSALEQYNAGLTLYLGYSTWMQRVDFPPTIDGVQRTMTPPITWGATTRRIRIGRFNDTYQILQGNLPAVNAEVLRRGGVFAPTEFWLVNVHEIARCTALCIRRRTEIMGIACKHSPMTTQLVQALSARPAPPGHWSQAWVSLQLGLAYAAEGKMPQAVTELQQSLTIGGQYDHPLTATGLLELGKIALADGQYSPAATYFMEATLSAAWFSQEPLMEEAFRWGTKNHILAGIPTPYTPLQPASIWSERMSQLLTTSLILDAAEIAVEFRNTADAARLLDRAARSMARTDMMASSVGLRFNFLSAIAHFQARELAAGDRAFAAALKFQLASSQKLFEIGLVDQLYTTGAVSERVADDLFREVLNDPTAANWKIDPLETLTGVLSPPFGPLEHWLALAIEREQTESAFEIADLIRRRRFYASLPMGGRLLAFRWIVGAPLTVLDDATKRQRQDLLNQNPAMAELVRRSTALQTELKTGDLEPATEEARQTQKSLFAELATVSDQQELLLRELALRRFPSEFVFPPKLDFQKLKATLPEGVLVLSFLNTRQAVYAFGISHESSSHPWALQSPKAIRAQVGSLLRQIGLLDRNRAVDVEQLQDGAWKEASTKLLSALSRNAKPSVWENADELVIVPDGPLWYVPFEALQVDDGTEQAPLISKVRVRYAPTLSLILPDTRGVSRVAQTAVVAGRLFPGDDPALTTNEIARMRDVVKGVTELTAPLPTASSLVATLCPRLVVLADIEDVARGPYDWSPMQIDREKSGGSLAQWMALPWGAPEQIILPGFHTPAENSLKRGGTGDELFFAACGMMASGSRTVLLSRWRPGGKSCQDLVREFVQELPYGTASAAWQRAVRVVGQQDIILDREPRVESSDLDVTLQANHPFFWAGNLLIDTGVQPKE